ncbi:MAG: hypothetical protein JJ974_10770 [Phycisphaerales bacterium]|nr:hypothetical protein [Phycisphaerales bacterium]
MFVKLIVLICVLGSTGVGVLSVRQSRLMVSNEMTQARMRARDLDRRGMELRAQIAERVTPEKLRALLGDDFDSTLVEETSRRIEILDPEAYEPVHDEQLDQVFVPADQQTDGAAETDSIEPTPLDDPGYWTLDDGTRVYILPSED